MVRKHTRRAAKAAFAVSLGVALLIGLVAAGYGSKTSTAKAAVAGNPKIILGSKNFSEETLLGQLYGQALKVKGFPVSYKPSIGSSELIDTAITSGKINLYPEYTGVIALDLAKVKTAPKTAKATYQAAKTFEQGRGLTLTNPTPFADTDTFTMLRSNANKHGLKKMSDLKKLSSFSYAGYPECQTRITCILGMKRIYGLKHIKFVQIGTISVYTLLDEHKADGGDGFSTDPQQLQKKYLALVDDKHIFGFQNVAPVVKKSLLSGPGGPLLKQTLNAVSAKLTLKAMQQMNKAIVIDKVSIKTVAKKFLQANGLA